LILIVIQHDSKSRYQCQSQPMIFNINIDNISS